MDLDLWLKGKETDIALMFEIQELNAYFRVRDYVGVLISALLAFEEALYKNKILAK
jgi:uncharacterized protein YcsI (UPF0317 family)